MTFSGWMEQHGPLAARYGCPACLFLVTTPYDDREESPVVGMMRESGARSVNELGQSNVSAIEQSESSAKTRAEFISGVGWHLAVSLALGRSDTSEGSAASRSSLVMLPAFAVAEHRGPGKNGARSGSERHSRHVCRAAEGRTHRQR